MKNIYFDMDGTIADLYGEKNWLDSLMNEKKGLFYNLPVMHDKQELITVINDLIDNGYNVSVITWMPKNVSDKYIEIVADEKRKWIAKHFPMIKDIYCLGYGVPKQKAEYKKSKLDILVDDNEEVLKLWETPIQRKIIKADNNLIFKLQNLLS